MGFYRNEVPCSYSEGKTSAHNQENQSQSEVSEEVSEECSYYETDEELAQSSYQAKIERVTAISRVAGELMVENNLAATELHDHYSPIYAKSSASEVEQGGNFFNFDRTFSPYAMQTDDIA